MKAVIVGSGLAGVTVAEGLAKGAQHEVHLITCERDGYYSRPRLSHGLSCDDRQAAKIVMKTFAQLDPLIGVTSGSSVTAIDRVNRRILLEDQRPLAFDLLILATGSAARIPATLQSSRDRFFTLNSLSDLNLLRVTRATSLAEGRSPRWAIIGGGLIGCELASDLVRAGDCVSIFHAAPRLMELLLDEETSEALHKHFTMRHVQVHYSQNVRAVEADVRGKTLLTDAGEAGAFDAVVVCTGFAPRTELALKSGLDVGRGITVDSFLGTSDPAIFAVGDVAQVEGHLYPYVSPIRSQAMWLATYLSSNERKGVAWQPPQHAPVIKVHDFKVPNRARV